MLKSILNTSALNLVPVMVCLGAAMVLGIISALLYMRTGKYTQSFVITLSILPLITASVILVVNGNLGAGLAVAGAFSLIRFRSAQGTAREILAVFLSMALGLCLGGGYVAIACLLLAAYALLLLLLNKLHFGAEKVFDRQLKISVPESLDYTGMFDDILSSYTKTYSLEKVRTAEMGSIYELTYHVTLLEQAPPRSMLDEIRTRNGNLPVSVGRVTVGISEL